MPLTPDTKDFLLHLYDKLWENMGSKEGRLWSYLAIYGAAVAIALGVGEYAGAQLYGSLVAMALTVWAVLIVVNANWWQQRNRLMIIQIEKRFGGDGGLNGIVPKSYQDGYFGFDRLYRGSTLILTGIAFFLYLKTLFKFRAGPVDSNLLVVSGLLYALFAAAVAYCAAEHHTYIRNYYVSKAELLIEGAEIDSARRGEIESQWHGVAVRYGWLWAGSLVLAIIFVAFDLLPGRPIFGTGIRACVAVALQVATLILFVIVVSGKGGKYSWWLQPLLYLLILISAAMLLSPWYSVISSPTPTIAGAHTTNS